MDLHAFAVRQQHQRLLQPRKTLNPKERERERERELLFEREPEHLWLRQLIRNRSLAVRHVILVQNAKSSWSKTPWSKMTWSKMTR